MACGGGWGRRELILKYHPFWPNKSEKLGKGTFSVSLDPDQRHGERPGARHHLVSFFRRGQVQDNRQGTIQVPSSSLASSSIGGKGRPEQGPNFVVDQSKVCEDMVQGGTFLQLVYNTRRYRGGVPLDQELTGSCPKLGRSLTLVFT